MDSYKKLVQDSFDIFSEAEFNNFSINRLSPQDALEDYSAIISNLHQITGIFGPKNSWPQSSLSLSDNISDLEWHYIEFQERHSFAYVIKNSYKKYMGCFYIYPSYDPNFEVMCFIWLCREESIFDDIIFKTLKKWVISNWPFKSIVFPGRDISWIDLSENLIDIYADYYIF